MIKIRNLDFSYGKIEVLKNINIDFEKGKYIALIGANGSGKTTLLNIINGNYLINNGQILIDDKEIDQYSIEDKAKLFAVINQNNYINFPFTCLEVVCMGRSPYSNRSSLSEKEMEMVVDIMKKTDTIKFANKLITEVSGGEYQRIILARALVQQPKVLFLDEAFSAMDLTYSLQCIKIIKQYVENNDLIVISIMHDINLIYVVSDEICVIKNGSIFAKGSTKEIMNKKLICDTYNINVEHIKDKGFLINEF